MRKITPALVGLQGPALQSEERELLRELQPVGVLLLSRNVTGWDQLKELCKQIREVLTSPHSSPLIAADQEGGAVSVLASAVGRPPSPAALGLADDCDLSWRVHRESARRAKAVGVNYLLAPVADVDRPGNPVIGIRAFGREEPLVSRHVAAAVRGLRDGGVLSCAKHWPGHGLPAVDSHLASVRLQLSRTQWERIDRPPFAAAIEEGVETVMVGHLSAPLLDRNGTIAPLSPAILSALRQELGFSGWIVSDALEMEGFGGASAERALAAGLQVLLFSAPVTQLAATLRALPRVAPPSLLSRPEGKDLSPHTVDRGEDSSWREAREKGVVLKGRFPSPVGDWVLLDGASADRLFPPPTEEFPDAASFAAALARVLGREPRRIVSWDPHAPFPFTSAQLETQLVDGEPSGLVYAGLRPLPEALEFFLKIRLKEGEGPFRWRLSLGLEPEAMVTETSPRLWIPGLSRDDLELLRRILGG